jgi:hypothetical protein
VVDVLFFDRFRVAFMPSHDVNLIRFDHTFELHFWLGLNDSFAELGGQREQPASDPGPSGAGVGSRRCCLVSKHGLHVIFVQSKLERDLLVTEVQTHEVQTQNPGL